MESVVNFTIAVQKGCEYNSLLKEYLSGEPKKAVVFPLCHVNAARSNNGSLAYFLSHSDKSILLTNCCTVKASTFVPLLQFIRDTFEDC